MSNVKEQIKSVFAKYGIDPSAIGIKFDEETAAPAVEATAEVKFSAEDTLLDGTKIYSTADAWAVGVDIYTQDADGNPVPVPAGEYVLADGVTKLVVGEDGMIAEISKNEQSTSTEMSSEDLVAVIGQLSERISALEAEKTALAAAVESAKKDAETAKTELASVKKAPAVPSVKSQEFKKEASRAASPSGNSFAEFMAEVRAKQSN